ncbi:MAG: type II toxin-antitoxin system RelE/ParE family toxin [Candidatus Dormibacteraceae bacterium]
MNVDWTKRARRDLSRIVDWAPKSAARIYLEVECLAKSPFPGAHRRLRAWPKDHARGVPPYIILYRVQKGYLVVTGIKDTRRHREPFY